MLHFPSESFLFCTCMFRLSSTGFVTVTVVTWWLFPVVPQRSGCLVRLSKKACNVKHCVVKRLSLTEADNCWHQIGGGWLRWRLNERMKENGKVGSAVNSWGLGPAQEAWLEKNNFEVMFSTVSNQNQKQQMCLRCLILACWWALGIIHS